MTHTIFNRIKVPCSVLVHVLGVKNSKYSIVEFPMHRSTVLPSSLIGCSGPKLVKAGCLQLILGISVVEYGDILWSCGRWGLLYQLPDVSSQMKQENRKRKCSSPLRQGKRLMEETGHLAGPVVALFVFVVASEPALLLHL
jgi:hypothetical protein